MRQRHRGACGGVANAALGDEMDPRALVCAQIPACLEALATAWPACDTGLRWGASVTRHMSRDAHRPYMACYAPAMFGNLRVRAVAGSVTPASNTTTIHMRTPCCVQRSLLRRTGCRRKTVAVTLAFMLERARRQVGPTPVCTGHGIERIHSSQT